MLKRSIVFGFMTVSSSVFAQAAVPPPPVAPLNPTLSSAQFQALTDAKKAQGVAEGTRAGTEDTSQRQFAGLNFGAALGVMIALGDRRIESGVLAPSGSQMVVRATNQSSVAARVLLETHYFFAEEGSLWGHGPFVAVQPGTNEVVVSLGVGYLVGWRRAKDSSASFNLGAGLMVEPAAKVLGDGVSANKPLPEGETEIRYQTKPITSAVLLASFSF